MMDGANIPRVSQDNDTGDLIIDETSGQVPSNGEAGGHFDNLLPLMEQSAVDAICHNLLSRVSEDKTNQKDFNDLLAKHVELLGIDPEGVPSQLDYDAADTSESTLLLTALTRFQSKATAAIMPQPHKVCRAKATMDFNEIKDLKERQQAKTAALAAERRVEDFYADYLFFRDQTYQEDTDRIIWETGLSGIGIRKVYNDLSRQRNRTRVEWVPIQNMIFSYDALSMTRGRISQEIRLPTSDLIRMIGSGQYEADNLVTQTASDPPDDALTKAQDKIAGITPSSGVGSTHLLYEVYTDLFIDADEHPLGLARPYVITIHEPSQKIISIKRNWQQTDPEEKRIETYVAYIYSPGRRASQGIGLGHLLGRLTKSLRDGQRDAFDAGRLQNMPFGYKLSNMSIRDGSAKISPGDFIDVDSPTDDIRSAIQMNMFQGPSAGLISLLQELKNDGKELGGIATMDFSQLMKSGVPVAPVLAALEESSEFQTSVHRRLYDAHATEMRLIHDRMQEVYGGSAVSFGNGKILHKGDLLSVDLLPVMKPGFVSKQKALIEAAALKEAAMTSPGVLDDRKVTVEYVRALGRDDIDDFLLPDPDDAPPPPQVDAVTEYVAVLRGQPIAAYLSQNHQAHIDAHTAQIKMIEVSQMSVADGERAMAALAAHIAEHYAKMMIVDIASRIGADPQVFANGIAPDMEAKVAVGIAKATARIEAERRPPEAAGESKVAVEQVRGQIKLTAEERKAQHDRAMKELERRHEKEMAAMEHQYALELQAQKDEAETERAEMDDDMAMEIAKMKSSGEISEGTRQVAGNRSS